MIFGIGLGRTGTRSLAHAVNVLGYKTSHGVHDFQWVHDYDFINDIWVGGRWEFLDYVYPNSKFILTTRNVDSWLRSVKAKASRAGRRKMDTYYNRFLVFGVIFRKDRNNDDRLRVAYYEYHAKVYRHFLYTPEKLLTMNIIDNHDGWEKLCSFLGKEVPSIPFPHKHKTDYGEENV